MNGKTSERSEQGYQSYWACAKRIRLASLSRDSGRGNEGEGL